MLYRQNSSKIVAPDSSLTGRSLADRSIIQERQNFRTYDPNFADPRYSEDPPPEPDDPMEYSIHTCGDMGNARLIRSECDHSAGIPGSLQSYTYYCKKYTRRPGSMNAGMKDSWGSFGQIESGKGTCEEDEICVNDWGSGNKNGQVEVAWCVNVRVFVTWGVESSADSRDKNVGVVLEGARLSAVASGVDEKTPLTMQAMDVEGGVYGPDGTGLVGADGTAVQSSQCENCVELETQQFAKGTDLLRLDARVSTVGAMVGGVLWLAVLAA